MVESCLHVPRGPQGLRRWFERRELHDHHGGISATATRDLADLVEKGALVRSGELKHARYALKLLED